MIVVQFTASSRVAKNICQKPLDAHSSRNETKEPQANAMTIARLSPTLSAAKLMTGVHRMRAKRGVASSAAI
jgi:hypothetical protein